MNEALSKAIAALKPFAEAYKPEVRPQTDPEFQAFLDRNTITPRVTMGDFRRAHEAFEALAALSHLSQEPVAWMRSDGKELRHKDDPYREGAIPLYTHPCASGKDAWISVNKQKPEHGVVVLVAVRSLRYVEQDEGTSKHEFYTVTEGQYTSNEHGGYMEAYQGRIGDLDDITHWMPLPAAPDAALAQKGGGKCVCEKPAPGCGEDGNGLACEIRPSLQLAKQEPALVDADLALLAMCADELRERDCDALASDIQRMLGRVQLAQLKKGGSNG